MVFGEENSMGIVTEISTLEEMCDLMCDNVLPTPKKEKPEPEGWWYFTFGFGQPNAGRYVKIWGTFESARYKMIVLYGYKWAFQYSEEEWEKVKNDPNRRWPMETELRTIE